ncbi:MAG: translation initiation factor IF-6 [Candidatus Heimdallarchaeaceae archaeon]
MDILKTTILGNSSLGIFAFSTDNYVMVPFGVKDNLLESLKKILQVDVFQTTLANSVLVGTMAVGNSRNILVPSNITEKEFVDLSANIGKDTQLIQLDTKYTALGNLIVINDSGAIISDLLEKRVQKEIQDSLAIEVVTGNLLNSPLIGSMVMATNRGALVHPLLSEEEIQEISSILHVQTDVCTVNRGIPYPRVGILANSKGAIIGSDCTGPESMRIFEILLSF